MISIKSGTQTWSKAAQDSSLKADQNETMSSQDLEKVLGDNKDIGEVLNKISDPNWVDPKKARQVGNGELGKDSFLKLLLAQLKNQDPTSPFESHEMAAQLAQFSSLEKLQNIEGSLNNIAQDKDPSKSYAALNLIGKTAQGDSTQIIRNSADEAHDIGFNLLADAERVEIRIANKFGDEIRKLEVKDLKKGQNKVEWQGLNEEGAKMGVGDYKVTIEAYGANGKKIAAETKFSGVVTGVNFTAEGPVLMMGQQKIKMSDIRSISNPNMKEDTKKAEVVNKVTEQKGAAIQNNQAPLLQDSIAMSSGMKNKVQKEIGTR